MSTPNANSPLAVVLLDPATGVSYNLSPQTQWETVNLPTIRPTAKRLVAVNDTGHALSYDYSKVNAPGFGLSTGGLGGWLKQIGQSGVLEVLAPDVVCYGDSHMDYLANSPGLAILQAECFGNIRDAAVGGETSTQILARWDSDVAPYADALHLFISSGQNDFKLGVANLTAAMVTAKANAIAILQKARLMRCNIVWVGCGPVVADNANFPASVKSAMKTYNEWLESICPQFGVTFYNMLRKFSLNYGGSDPLNDLVWANPSQMCQTDQLHLNADGYQALLTDLTYWYGLPIFLESLTIYSPVNAAVPPVGSIGVPTTFSIKWNGSTTQSHTLAKNWPIKDVPVPSNLGGTTGAALTGGLVGVTIDITAANGAPTYSWISNVEGNFTHRHRQAQTT